MRGCEGQAKVASPEISEEMTLNRIEVPAESGAGA